MKLNKNNKRIILLTLGIVFTFSAISICNFNFTARPSNYSSPINFDYENLKFSKISGPISITGNSGWANAQSTGICTGNGTHSDPYVIEDLVINGGGSGSCIFIKNSNVYFKIENCSVYNSGGYPNAGIRLSSVINSQLIDNNCSSNYIGIRLEYSENNIISGNTANYNEDGIQLLESDNNTISGNTANYNRDGIYIGWYSYYNTISGNIANDNIYGIYLYESYNSTISENTANYNGYGIYIGWSIYNTATGNTANDNSCGIYLYGSNNNIISGNILLGNLYCILDEHGEGNIIENNDCGGGNEKIPGYHLFFLLGILSMVAILICKKLKKS